jgi:DNA-binding transcriptional MerR regulator
VPKLTISRVAAAAGVNVETIRYYQRRGLLEEPAKPLAGYRHYPTEMVKRIRFVKRFNFLSHCPTSRAQSLGFTLEDVAGLLQLNDSDACTKTRHWIGSGSGFLVRILHNYSLLLYCAGRNVNAVNKPAVRA